MHVYWKYATLKGSVPPTPANLMCVTLPVLVTSTAMIVPCTTTRLSGWAGSVPLAIAFNALKSRGRRTPGGRSLVDDVDAACAGGATGVGFGIGAGGGGGTMAAAGG